MRRSLLLIWLVLQCGCGPAPEEPAPEYGEPQPPVGRILIEELFYSGSPPAAGSDHYNADQFIEIYNVSTGPVALGGLLIGDVYGLAGEINPGSEPDSLATDDPDRVYLQNLWRIPGEPEDVLLHPGETLLIAQDGTNHQPYSAIDSTGADFEAYVESSGNDADYPTVPNLDSLHYTGGFDWLMTVFGPSVVLLEPGAEAELEDHTVNGWWDLKSAPSDLVIDALESLMDEDSGAYKRLPESVDAGFTYVSGTYSGESVRRRQVDGALSDTNDSSQDFEVDVPSPYGL